MTLDETRDRPLDETRDRLPTWAQSRPFVVAMLHLRPLPGSPQHSQSMEEIEAAMVADLTAYSSAGVDAVLLENFGDAPFFPTRVPEITVAALTRLATTARAMWSGGLGINVLRNDGQTALAIAHCVQADFIRVNVLASARVTDQGLITGIAHDLLRARRAWDADGIQIWADVDVKHSAALASRSLEEETADLIHRAGADVLIVSGSRTGSTVNTESLKRVAQTAGNLPVVVGSGVTAAQVPLYTQSADGFIVGTSLKQDGQVLAAVDPSRVQELMQVVQRQRSETKR